MRLAVVDYAGPTRWRLADPSVWTRALGEALTLVDTLADYTRRSGMGVLVDATVVASQRALS